MDDRKLKEEYQHRIDELTQTIERLAAHNMELKTLILRSGDGELKGKLEKLMRTYSGARVNQNVA